MKILKNNCLYIIGIIMSLVAVSCKDCNNGNPAHTPNTDVKSEYQLILDGIGASAFLEGSETYSFFIVNKNNQNAVPTDEILLSLESEIEFTLNNYSVDSQGLTLKRILEVDKIKPSAPQEVVLKLKNAKGRSVAASIKLQLKDKTGNKIGEEESLVWRPKVGIQLDLQITNKNLKGNEKENKKIEFKVASLGTTIPDKDAISLNLIPEDGTTATIVDATSQATVNGKIIYTYQVKKEDINKTITSLSIDPQGSKQASFKVQLVYDGNLVGPEQTLTWQADEPLALGFEASEEKYKDIVTGMKSLIGTDIVEISIKNLGKDIEDDEVLLCVEQDSPAEEIAFEVYYNYQAVDEIGPAIPSINLKHQKQLEMELMNLSDDGAAIKKGNIIKIVLQLVDPKVKQQASITFRMRDAQDKSEIAKPVTINWRAVTPTTGAQEVSDEMIRVVEEKCRENSMYTPLKNVLSGIKDGKKDIDINKVDKRAKAYATVLKQAIFLNRADIVELLLNHGANLDSANKLEVELNQQSLLYFAISISQGYEEIALILLARLNMTADIINQHSEYKRTMLFLALEHNLSQVSEALIDKGADVNISYQGVTPLHMAVSNLTTGVDKIVLKMIEKGANLSQENGAGITPFHLLVKKNYIGIVQAILNKPENDALKSNRNRVDKTPLDFATTEEMRKLLE
ncbi:MAG: ankyrin repeat domain-containing protein [Candidatus Amoebophilus sp.]